MLRKMQLYWEKFGLLLRSDGGPRGPRRVIKAPLGWVRWIQEEVWVYVLIKSALT